MTMSKRSHHKDLVTQGKARPCMDCGRSYPKEVMEFDHVRGKKLFELADAWNIGRERILAEMAKCDVVCANCHRLRTIARRGVRALPCASLSASPGAFSEPAGRGLW